MLRRAIPSVALLALVLPHCSGPSEHPDGGVDVQFGPGDGSRDAPSGDALDDTVTRDASGDVPLTDAQLDDVPLTPAYCSLGSDVQGAVLPAGFCMRHFATINEPRVLAMAPNGDLFVAAPSMGTPGTASGGPGAIVVLSDDNHDGVAEQHTFADHVADVHGLVVAPDAVYFTTTTAIWRTPYTPGQRAETAGARQQISSPTNYGNGRWTHGLARSAGGTLYTSSAEYGSCAPGYGGKILRVESTGDTTLMSSGFRNPMYERCHFRDELCLGAELGEDSDTVHGREKIVVIGHEGNWYGYPCCATTNVASGTGKADCSAVTAEDASFPINNTPFGLDWERGSWPAPYRDALFVALHGSFYSTPAFEGASVVYGPTDPTTHVPTGNWQPFITGWSRNPGPLRRPADAVFGADGRLFVADDVGNAVYWIAPQP